MIVKCAYCTLNTAGQHEWNCPLNANRTVCTALMAQPKMSEPELPPLPEGLRYALLNAHIDGDELLAYCRACRQAAERELAEVRADRDKCVKNMNDNAEYADALRAQLDGMHRVLRQLLDLWEAGMPDETARQDMVEAFAAVRATFTVAEASAEKP